MEYTYPQFFYDFKCEASACSDTCCAGWGISIDPVSLRKYRKYPGFFGNRLRNSINWKEKSFDQYGGRCVLLNEDKLCDVYLEAGPEMLCKTCTRYPRHYEEYENLREVSLSLSCPAAAKLILGSERMTFLSECRRTPEEEYESFDFFLFTKLQEIRDYLFSVIQDRELGIDRRMALLLAVSHDLQSRIDRKQLYAVDALLERCRSDSFKKHAGRRFAPYAGQSAKRRFQMHQMYRRLYRLEVLRPSWPAFLKEQERRLYRNLSEEAYAQAVRDFEEACRDREYEFEQLLMYFTFLYVCGAVYDGDLFSKVKFAVVSTLLIRELDMAVWLKNGRHFTLDDQVEVAHRYAREIEHSDPNLNAMERMLSEEERFTLERLLTGILG